MQFNTNADFFISYTRNELKGLTLGIQISKMQTPFVKLQLLFETTFAATQTLKWSLREVNKDFTNLYVRISHHLLGSF